MPVGAADWPSARLDTAVWVAAAGDNPGPDPTLLAAYIFGGEGVPQEDLDGMPGALASFWRWSVADGWRWLAGSNATNAAAVGTSLPGARSRSIAWVDPDTSAAWILGGYGFGVEGSSIDYLNDLWRYTNQTNGWEWIGGSNQSGAPALRIPDGSQRSRGDQWPGGKQGHQAYVVNGRWYIHGGVGFDDALSSADEQARGILRAQSQSELWSLAKQCTSGMQVKRSTAACYGSLREVCIFDCEDGYQVNGTHVCGLDQVFRGGNCVASTCDPPAFGFGQRVVDGCVANGTMGNDTCLLGCQNGASGAAEGSADDRANLFIPSQITTGTCLPDAGQPTASYQGSYVKCTLFEVRPDGSWYFQGDSSKDANGLYGDLGIPAHSNW